MIALYLAIAYLCLVVAGVSYTDVHKIPLIGNALGYFSFASGASNSYGFFAPDVAGQLRVLFDIAQEDGKTATIPLQITSSHEADLRLGNIVDHYFSEDEDPESLQRGLATSFAGKIFARYPKARTVAVRFEVLEPVSWDEYDSGRRPEWAALYETTFELNKVGASEASKNHDEYL
jgi:hypothetical protein